MNEIWTRPRKCNTPTVTIEPKFKVYFENDYIITDGKINNLSLMAIKRDSSKSYQYKQEDKIEGYLFLDEINQKLYYSEGNYDNPKYLCDWNLTISANRKCQEYNVTICKNGDLLFIMHPKFYFKREIKPLLYKKSNNYLAQEITLDINPHGFLSDNAVVHDFNNDCLFFAEYRGWGNGTSDDGQPLYIWKVNAPYDTQGCWSRVSEWTHIRFDTPNGTTSNPEREINHFHTLNRDFYSNQLIATTGDSLEQVRFITSNDNGVTWVDNPELGGGQKVRTVGLIFREDGAYYQTDSTLFDHALYKIPRKSDGYLDYSKLTKICQLSNDGSAGYCTAYIREPNGLFMINRLESTETKDMQLEFYSFEYNKLFDLGMFSPIDGYNQFEMFGRYGIPFLAYTHYQPSNSDGIICGSTSKYKPFLLNIIGNNKEQLIKTIKIKIIKEFNIK